MKDWTGNKNSIYKTLGASNHTEKERQSEDYYATDPYAVDCLLEKANPDKNIWECACGEGHLSKRLTELGYEVYSTDLIYRGYGMGGGRFPQMSRNVERGYTHKSTIQICTAVCRACPIACFGGP